MRSAGCWVEGHWAWLLLALEVLAVGCGGGTKAPTPQVGDSTSSGAGGAEEARPRVLDVPYAVDACDSLGLSFDAQLSTLDCPTISCDCQNFVSGPFAGPRGCVVGLDCDAACAQLDPDQWLFCAVTSCTRDSDCVGLGGNCLIPPSYDHGSCGHAGVDCLADSDCESGSFCVVLDQDGTRRCTEPAPGASCNYDRQCAGQACALPPGSLVGACSSGGLGERCFAESDCDAGLYCGTGTCANGSYNSGCHGDKQCATGSCRWETCVEGRDGDYCEADDDCGSGVCVYGIRCASGEVDAACEEDNDCKSGICAGDNYDSACTDGIPGSKCIDDADCRAGRCVHDAAREPGSRFGSCG